VGESKAFIDSPDTPDIRALLAQHLDFAKELSPNSVCMTLDLTRRRSDIEVVWP